MSEGKVNHHQIGPFTGTFLVLDEREKEKKREEKREKRRGKKGKRGEGGERERRKREEEGGRTKKQLKV